MKRDEIIRMAREVGILDFRDEDNSEYVKDVLDDLERFASLVAAAEREAILSKATTARAVDGNCAIVLVADIRARSTP